MVTKKIHRFITKYKKEGNSIHVSDQNLIHQWKNVLKFKQGEKIILSWENIDTLVEINKISNTDSTLKILGESKNTKEPNRKVNLFLAILKKENFELAVQKATELGIYSITPLITDRTIKTGLNIERLNKISKEASELSGRSSIPLINKTIRFNQIFNTTKDNIILFDISGEKFHKLEPEGTSISIIIGPEGGFTEEEIKLAKDSSSKIASISPLTLRGETATIIASYLSIYS